MNWLDNEENKQLEKEHKQQREIERLKALKDNELVDKKPVEYKENQLPIGVIEACNKLNEIFPYDKINKVKVTNEDFPRFLYHLIIECKNQLIIIKNEIGVEHIVYEEKSTVIVELCTEFLVAWIIQNQKLAIMPIPIKGNQLGVTLLDICDRVVEEIDMIEMKASTRTEFDTHFKKAFNLIKERMQPKSGCYIATMTYGDYNHPKVLYLRQFRNNTLKKYFIGRKFINVYYFISPIFVKLLVMCQSVDLLIGCYRNDLA